MFIIPQEMYSGGEYIKGSFTLNEGEWENMLLLDEFWWKFAIHSVAKKI